MSSVRCGRGVSHRLGERDVRGEVEDVEVAGREHEAEVLHAELVGQQLGVAGPLVAAGLHRRLVQRSGHDAVDGAVAGETAGLDHEAVGAVPGDRAQLADGAPRRARGRSATARSAPGRSPAARGSSTTRTASGSSPARRAPARIASASPDHDRHADRAQLGVLQQRLRGDLRTDPGDVAEGQGQDGQGGGLGHGVSSRVGQRSGGWSGTAGARTGAASSRTIGPGWSGSRSRRTSSPAAARRLARRGDAGRAAREQRAVDLDTLGPEVGAGRRRRRRHRPRPAPRSGRRARAAPTRAASSPRRRSASRVRRRW